jgi:lysophospholipase L1-like esterase
MLACPLRGQTLNIWTLGDSITWGVGDPGGYQTELYTDLTTTGFNVNLLGTVTANPSPILTAAGQTRQGGYPGAETGWIDNNIDSVDVNNGYASPDGGYWLTTNSIGDPDFVLLDIGTNDIGIAAGNPGDGAAAALTNLAGILHKISVLRPDATILVSNLTPRADSDVYESELVNDFNPYVPGVVATADAAGERVAFVDIFDALTISDLNPNDHIHPTPTGYNIFGDVWANAIEQLVPAPTTDIGSGDKLISYTIDPEKIVLSELASGYNGGAWNGPGIFSTAAAQNHSFAVGFADGADGVDHNLTSGQIELYYTLYGDINLDGVVNGNDFAILAAHYGKSVTGGWEDGDLNYDGTVDGNDFALLAANFGKSDSDSSVVIPATQWAALDAFAAAHGLLADVPEPSTLAGTILGGALLLRRRRLAWPHGSCLGD